MLRQLYQCHQANVYKMLKFFSRCLDERWTRYTN